MTFDQEAVRQILESAGPRGASHEDFVQAGLAATYVDALHHLVDVERLEIRTDFTTGQARWVLAGTAIAA